MDGLHQHVWASCPWYPCPKAPTLAQSATLETLKLSPAPLPVFLLAVRDPKSSGSQDNLPTLEVIVTYLPQLDAVGQAAFGIRRLESDSGLAIY